EAKRKFPLLEGSAPLASLLQVQELLPEGSLQERFVSHGWQSVSDLAAHSAEALCGLADVPVNEALQLEWALRALSLELPFELPPRILRNPDALRPAFRAKLAQLKGSLSPESEKAISSLLPPVSRSLNEELLQLVPKSYDDRKRRIV